MSESNQKLIGVSGKMGAGKDTVGLIITGLTATNPVSDGVLAHAINMNSKSLMLKSEWIIKKMAGKLKDVAALLAGVPSHLFENQEFKQEKMGPEWGDMTYREFLQKIGTDALRDNVHNDIWANSLFADVTGSSKWVVTDVRFPNEAEAIKSRKGILIRVNTTREVPASDHPSETSLDDYKGFDYIVDNSGTMEALVRRIRDILVKEGIIKNPE